MNRWRVVGLVGTALAWLMMFAVQIVSGDWLPPRVSVSQYGVGPHGWLFTLWTIALAPAVLGLYLAHQRRDRVAGIMLGLGVLGAVVMGAVRTDANGLQASGHAKVHMVASIVTLLAIPAGICLAMAADTLIWRRIAIGLTVASALGLILLLLAAFGWDTAGLGSSQQSWAFWQGVAIGLDMLLLLAFAGGSGSPRPERAVPQRGV